MTFADNHRLKRPLLRTSVGVSLAWLVFVLVLDIFYGMFPRVTIGGLKIVAFSWIVMLVIFSPVWLFRRKSRRNRD